MLYGKYERMIDKLAWGCLRRMPEGFTTLEDLKQEASLIYVKLLHKRFRPENGTSFGTVLYKAITNHYSKLLRYAYRPKHINAICVPGENFEQCPDELNTPQEALMRKENEEKILNRLKEIDRDIHDLVVNGPPAELMAFAKKSARVTAYKRGCRRWEDRLTWPVIESFYGVNLESIIQQIHTAIPKKIKRVSLREGLWKILFGEYPESTS